MLGALLRFVQSGDGARASARFNVREEEALETPSLLVFCELKRRERRAPLPPYSCHSNSRTSIRCLTWHFNVFDGTGDPPVPIGDSPPGAEAERTTLSVSHAGRVRRDRPASGRTKQAGGLFHPASSEHFAYLTKPSLRRLAQSSFGLKIPAGVMMPVISSVGVTSKPGFRAPLVGFATRM